MIFFTCTGPEQSVFVFRSRNNQRKGRKPNQNRRTTRRGGRAKPRMSAPRILVGRNALRPALQVPRTQVTVVHKWADQTELKQANAVDAFGTFQFTLADTEAVSFAPLFEQYRITKIEMTFRPMFRANGASLSGSYIMPLIYVAVDPNDVSSWSLRSQAQSHDNVTVLGDEEPFTISFEPSVATAVYNGAFSGFGHQRNIWIDTGTTGARYYGVKWCITAGVTPDIQHWEVVSRYTVAFRFGK